MSLLLDALKRAEKAKEAAQRGDKEADVPRASGLSLEPTPEDAKRVMTRDKLPDISTPLEIGSDDLSPRQVTARAGNPPASPEANPRPQTAPPAAPGRASARGAQGNPVAQRAAAQSVFEAKFKEPNPRLPFYITIGALGAFAIGTIVYFWIQLRPPPPLVNANPTPPTGVTPVETAKAPAPIPGAPPSATGPGQAIPGLPGAAPSGTGTSSARTAPTAISASAPKAPSTKPPAEEAKPVPRSEPVASGAPAPAATRRIARTEASSPVAPTSAPRSFGRRTVARVNPGVAAGFAAYQSGDLEGARRGYQQALHSEPRNVDALLGMAAVELRMRQYAMADRYYQHALRLDPRNPYAQAGMLALRNQQVDPVAAESQVKTLIAQSPRAEDLQFTLGNQYAQQGRWDEAQQAYFKALAADPNNPDFAYNLAVSLDHLRQAKPALQHYQLALKLAESRGAGFDAEAVRTRVAQLEH